MHLLKAEGISKAFPGVQALQDVNLHVDPGEILALIGENGAGKSTLMKILAGIYQPDAGELWIDGQPVRLTSVRRAEAAGIVLIHQELNLADNLDVAGNVFLGREPTVLGLIHPRIYRDAEAITRRLGLRCSPRTRVSTLTVGQQQLVEIARALSQKSRLLILDEPTSSLTSSETEKLFEVMRQLKAEGLSMIYITHRLPEIEKIADRVTVLRDGRNAGGLTREEIVRDRMVQLMVGRDLKQFLDRHRPHVPLDKPPVLEVRELRWSAAQRPISFQLRAGEIVGMAGLIGAGRTELAETLFGIRTRVSGTILIDGKPVHIRHPDNAIRAGLFLIPEDRRQHGLILSDSIKENISLPSLDALSVLCLVQRGREGARAREQVQRLQVRTSGIDKPVGQLSGGNQQKVVLGKWLARQGRVLIFDEPTRGVDVGAKHEIYTMMDELANQGLAILMISSDMEEVLGISDRVLVMAEHTLAGEVSREKKSELAILQLAIGKGSMQ